MRHSAAAVDAKLDRYRARRDFAKTPEPLHGKPARGQALSFVVQKHAATRLHYDFRLELDGVLLSWAVPKGPSYDPADKRMAVRTEDHPLSYAGFEGEIPEGQYGAGSVVVWDRGHWQPLADPRAGLAGGKLAFELHGEKLQGLWELVRIKSPRQSRQEAWLLFKRRDALARSRADYDVVSALPDSVLGSRHAAEPRRSADTKETRMTQRETSTGRRPRATPARDDASHAGGITISSPKRVIDASTGTTKIELVRYYESVAAHLLPHLKGRAVALVRGPTGIGGQLFFQRHDDKRAPDAPVQVATLKALLQAAQLNVIEFHTGNTRPATASKPDRVVFDLDPGEGVAWAQVQEGAQLLRALLDQLELKAWLKTSGGKGLHLVLPIAARWQADAVKAFAKAVVDHLARTIPDRFVAKSGAANRVGRIFVDYLRNGSEATTVAAFSARARPGLGVSMPLAWDDLPGLRSGAHFTVANARDHLSFVSDDPWRGYATTRQSLSAAIKLLGSTKRPA